MMAGGSDSGLPDGRSDQSFPRQERIRRRAEFTHTYEHGRKTRGRYVTVFTCDTDRGHARIGITVTRKLGRAHARNRMKRWIREIYRTSRSETGLVTRSLDLVVNVSPAAKDASFDDFSRDLRKTLRRASNPAVRE